MTGLGPGVLGADPGSLGVAAATIRAVQTRRNDRIIDELRQLAEGEVLRAAPWAPSEAALVAEQVARAYGLAVLDGTLEVLAREVDAFGQALTLAGAALGAGWSYLTDGPVRTEAVPGGARVTDVRDLELVASISGAVLFAQHGLTGTATTFEKDGRTYYRLELRNRLTAGASLSAPGVSIDSIGSPSFEESVGGEASAVWEFGSAEELKRFVAGAAVTLASAPGGEPVAALTLRSSPLALNLPAPSATGLALVGTLALSGGSAQLSGSASGLARVESVHEADGSSTTVVALQGQASASGPPAVLGFLGLDASQAVSGGCEVAVAHDASGRPTTLRVTTTVDERIDGHQNAVGDAADREIRRTVRTYDVDLRSEAGQRVAADLTDGPGGLARPDNLAAAVRLAVDHGHEVTVHLEGTQHAVAASAQGEAMGGGLGVMVDHLHSVP